MTSKKPTYEQSIALLNLHSEFAEAVSRHIAGLFSERGLGQPVPGDAAGRDVYAILGETHPRLAEHLQAVFGEWTDALNKMTADAARHREVILAGRPPMAPTVN